MAAPRKRSELRAFYLRLAESPHPTHMLPVHSPPPDSWETPPLVTQLVPRLLLGRGGSLQGILSHTRRPWEVCIGEERGWLCLLSSPSWDIVSTPTRTPLRCSSFILETCFHPPLFSPGYSVRHFGNELGGYVQLLGRFRRPKERSVRDRRGCG